MAHNPLVRIRSLAFRNFLELMIRFPSLVPRTALDYQVAVRARLSSPVSEATLAGGEAQRQGHRYQYTSQVSLMDKEVNNREHLVPQLSRLCQVPFLGDQFEQSSAFMRYDVREARYRTISPSYQSGVDDVAAHKDCERVAAQRLDLCGCCLSEPGERGMWDS